MNSSIDTFSLFLQEIRRPDSKFRLEVNWWSSILKVKQLIQEKTDEPPSRQHIYHATNPTELSNTIMLHDLGIEKSGYMLWIAIDYRSGNEFSIAPAKDVELDAASKEMIEAVRLGLQRNKPPIATEEFEGSGGVYFMRNKMGSCISVFKPHDEEQGMPNNPKDHVGTGVHGLREYFTPGQGCLREVAAYFMDVRHFSSVPITTLVHCEHPVFHYPLHNGIHSKDKPFPKLGSLQEFIGGAELFDDIGSSLLSDFEVQKIALLDMRILNCDRNAANILVLRKDDLHAMNDSTESFHFDNEEFVISGSPHGGGFGGDHHHHNHNHDSYQLIPIDHGYSMPSKLKIVEWDWAWFNYPHISRPVHPDLIEYVKSIDIDALVTRLHVEVNISDDCTFLIRVAHHLLLTGLLAGLTLKDLAVIFVRSGDDEDIQSRLERAIDEAEENAYRAIELKTNRTKSHSPTSTFGLFDERSSRSTSRESNSDTSSTTTTEELFSRPPLILANSCTNFQLTRNHCSTSSLSTFPETVPIPTSLGSRGKSWCPSECQLDTIAERRERSLSSVSNTSLSDYDSGPSQAGSFDPKSAGADFLLLNGMQSDPSETHCLKKAAHSPAQIPISSPPIKSPLNSMAPEQGHGLFSTLSGTPLRSLRSVESNNISYNSLNNNSGGKLKRSEAIQIPVPPSRVPPVSYTDNSPNSLVCFPYGSPYLRESSLLKSIELSGAEDDYVMCDVEELQELQEDFGTNYQYTETVSGTDIAISATTITADADAVSHSTAARCNDDDNYQDILFDVPLAASIPLSRVVSFSGFESRPLYTNPSIRAMGNLRLERRKVIAETSEFKQLRFDFARSLVSKIVQRIVANKKALSIR